MYGGFALAIAFWKRPAGSFNGVVAFMLTGFTIALHEILWFVTYFIVHPIPADIWMNLQVYGSFIAFAIEGVFVFFLVGFNRYLNKRLMLMGFGVLLAFYAGWGLMGYPLTLDLKTGDRPPALFGVTWVDAIEFYSWVFAFAVVGLAYVKEKLRPPH